MDRKKFIRNGILGIASLATASKILESCSKSDNETDSTSSDGSCTVSPSETKGPFPIKTPSQLVLENIKSDRVGIALLINLKIENKKITANLFLEFWSMYGIATKTEIILNTAVRKCSKQIILLYTF